MGNRSSPFHLHVPTPLSFHSFHLLLLFPRTPWEMNGSDRDFDAWHNGGGPARGTADMKSISDTYTCRWYRTRDPGLHRRRRGPTATSRDRGTSGSRRRPSRLVRPRDTDGRCRASLSSLLPSSSSSSTPGPGPDQARPCTRYRTTPAVSRLQVLLLPLATAWPPTPDWSAVIPRAPLGPVVPRPMAPGAPRSPNRLVRGPARQAPMAAGLGGRSPVSAGLVASRLGSGSAARRNRLSAALSNIG